MSIERFHDQFTPICDLCGTRLPGEFSFMDAVEAKKDAGWKSRKIDGEWEDVCTDCQFEEAGYVEE